MRARCSAMTPEVRSDPEGGGGGIHPSCTCSVNNARCRHHPYRFNSRDELVAYIPTHLDRLGAHSFDLGDAVWSAAAYTGCAEARGDLWTFCHHPPFLEEASTPMKKVLP